MSDHYTGWPKLNDTTLLVKMNATTEFYDFWHA